MFGTGKGLCVCRFAVPACLTLLALAAGLGTARAQNPNEIQAPPLVNVEDKDDITKPDSKIWVLNFNFYPLRQTVVDIPGRGRRMIWYMRYEVINNTKEPRLFIPDFELVALDKPGTVYHDQVLPKVQEAIRQEIDPLGHLDIKNSVTISNKPIPVSRPDGPPRPVTGIAIWENVDPEANRFSVFVSGLSNGWSLAEVPPDNKQIIRRKTLQLNFKRVGDKHSSEIRFVPPIEWTYRATGVSLPGPKSAAAEAPKK